MKIKQNPAWSLLLFVYLWVIPTCLSFQNAWVQPEQLFIKTFLLKTGENLNLKDLKNGLFWQLFEYKARPTRPLSSYFEIIDTKFRCWLWHFISPHPSLSLTWIFSLFLAPLLLFRLLRNLDIGLNISFALTAFYLATPGVLSFEAMLFRPGKPMTNFFIIFCLYLASKLQKEFLNNNNPIPLIKFMAFWAVTAVSFYWDETALLIFPAVLFIFPSMFHRKSFLMLWLLLPLVTLAAYLEIIPYLCTLAGHEYPHLLKYDDIQLIFKPEHFFYSLKYFGVNAWNLIFETMGIFPFALTAPKLIPLAMACAVIAWATLLFNILKTKIKFDPLFIFLIFLLFLFNTMMSVTTFVWGPYYYGSYWSIFFVIFLSKYIERAKVPPFATFICFFFIIISTANCFLGMNIVNKKYYWYPYSPETIADYYKGTRLFYDKRDKPAFSDKEIRSAIYQYWARVKTRKTGAFSLPRELGWLPIELEPEKSYNKSLPGAVFKKTFQEDFNDGTEIFDWLVQKGYLVKYPSGDCFIKEDLDTTITSGLKVKYPDRWKKILTILQDSLTRKPYFYNFTPAQQNADIDKINPDLAEDYNIYSMDIAANPKLAEAYNDRGNIYFKAGNFNQAISDYSKAVKLKPDLEDAYYNLGFIYYKLGNLVQAILNYSQAIKINPKDAGAYNDRAVIYFKLHEYYKAWDDVNIAKKLGSAVNPQLIDALRQITARKN